MDGSDPLPQPGPAQLPNNAGPDDWLRQAKLCKYLPEGDMKKLCEMVKECLMEGECHPGHIHVRCKGLSSSSKTDIPNTPFGVVHRLILRVDDLPEKNQTFNRFERR